MEIRTTQFNGIPFSVEKVTTLDCITGKRRQRKLIC